MEQCDYTDEQLMELEMMAEEQFKQDHIDAGRWPGIESGDGL